MKIYNYILRVNPEAQHAFTEKIIENVEPIAGGWAPTNGGTWDTTRYYSEMQMSNAQYQPLATVASETPIPDVKQKLCKFVEEKLTEQLMRHIEEVQTIVVWLGEESVR